MINKCRYKCMFTFPSFVHEGNWEQLTDKYICILGTQTSSRRNQCSLEKWPIPELGAGKIQHEPEIIYVLDSEDMGCVQRSEVTMKGLPLPTAGQ
jgi:hypothetical protein